MVVTLVLSEPMPRPGMDLLQGRPDLALRVLARPSGEALAEALADADGVILVAERPVLTAPMIAAAPRLRVAARMGAGTDNFDTAALTARGIPLLTTGSANAGAVAEHALYLLLALAKRGPARDRAIKAGGWPRGFGAVELAGKTCVVVGLGRIGREIARRAAAFGMRVVGVDPAFTEAAGAALGIAVAPSLDSALADADAVILACALTAATRGLIGAAALARMKPTALLVNVARGGVVDEAALARALEAGQLAGAGLDVLAAEPPSADNPLLVRDDVVLTPHTASHVTSTYDRMSVVCARAVMAALDGRPDPALVANPQTIV
ncbi:MAG: NAD(P)-dependent oxidoreductase [Hyphomicrobiaceae bacterium]